MNNVFRNAIIFSQVLQKLGKADETKDLAFEEGVINFNKQLVSVFLTYIFFKCLKQCKHWNLFWFYPLGL